MTALSTKIRTQINRMRQSRLLRDSLWMLLGQGARVPIQMIYFILIARSIGVSDYGAFVGVTALVAVLAPFAPLGSGGILIKNTARDRNCFPYYWAKALFMTTLMGSILFLAVAAFWRFFLPVTIPTTLVLSVAFADLIVARVGDITILAFQAFQRLGRTSFLFVLPNLCRLVALLGVLLIEKTPTAELWGYFYLLSGCISTAVGVFLTCRELGLPRMNWKVAFSELREGMYFSVSISSLNIYNDIDKTILTRLSTLEAAGIYGAAYRIIDVAFIPVRSVLAAAYARFFQNGVNGIHATLAFAWKVLPLSLAYMIVASLILFTAAPLLPVILGDQYQQTVEALRWLAVLPILRGLQYFAADSLTGAGYQGIRSACQILTAIFNVVVTIWLVPIYSWKGAAWASIASDLLLAISIWSSALWLSRVEPRRPRRVRQPAPGSSGAP